MSRYSARTAYFCLRVHFTFRPRLPALDTRLRRQPRLLRRSHRSTREGPVRSPGVGSHGRHRFGYTVGGTNGDEGRSGSNLLHARERRRRTINGPGYTNPPRYTIGKVLLVEVQCQNCILLPSASVTRSRYSPPTTETADEPVPKVECERVSTKVSAIPDSLCVVSQTIARAGWIGISWPVDRSTPPFAGV